MNEILIIGAGPAGLAMAGRLRNAGIDFRIIEKGSHVGERWHHHYDRLHLHTVKRLSHLPHLEFPDDYPTYIAREQLISYFEQYAATFDIEPEFGVTVHSVYRDHDGSWHVKTDQGDLTARHVVIATGVNNQPRIPQWHGQKSFKGDITHSIDYRNPAPFMGGRVLVVGMGNTGAEIALDLAEHGIPVWLSVRGAVNIVPRDLNGRPVQETGRLLARLPFGIGDWIGARVQNLYYGNLSRYGLIKSKLSPAAQLRETGKSPVIDIGTIDAIKHGKIQVVGEVEELFALGAHILNNGYVEVEHIILATGYQSCLKEIVARMPEFLDRHGYPKGAIGDGYHSGLYFVGFNNYEVGGILGTIYTDTEVVLRRLSNA